ncbi:hypothetical protein M770_34010 (plasmid) [Pseudomonas aeruginosa VRFPA03]|nr:hypothetical protein M770_34010 [Pseudomonas aeruginosa VRFPA03]
MATGPIAHAIPKHIWTFAQTVKVVTREEAEKASGLKIEGWV